MYLLYKESFDLIVHTEGSVTTGKSFLVQDGELFRPKLDSVTGYKKIMVENQINEEIRREESFQRRESVLRKRKEEDKDSCD